VVAVLLRPRRPSRPAVELPLVVDLLAATLRGGALLPTAVEVAAGAATADLRDRLTLVARALRAGAEAEEAWAGCTTDPELVQVARICLRTGGSGAGAAAELERLARRLRVRRRTDTDARSARAAVWVVLPLCLCFLPAFVLVGVVPMAVGLLAGVR
jgi:Flp pilus assembly protein TadB